MKIENIVEEEKNSFLCSVMNSGFGRIILPLTLSSSLLLNSCASTSQSYDWREEPRTETKEEKILDERVISEGIRYDIQQEKIHNTNVIDIPVIEEKFEEKTVRKRIIEKARFDQYRIVTTKKSSASTSIGLGVILSLGIGLLGSLVGSTITNWSSKEEQNKAATQGFYVGAGAGFMIGLIVGATKNDFKEWDSNSYRTGTSETRTLIDKIVTENQDFIISSIPAKNLKLKLGGKDIGFKESLVYTNKDGIASAMIVQLPYNYAFNNDVLIKKIRSWDKIKGLSPSFVNNVVERINDNIINTSLTMNVETLGKGREGLNFINDSETMPIPVKYIREYDVDNAVNGLLKEKEEQAQRERQIYIRKIVNKLDSNIMTFTVYIEDEVSHARIPADITIISYAPTSESFLDDYLRGNELRQALSLVRDYPSFGRSVTEDVYDGVARFGLYVPSRYHIKIINPNYHFFEGDIELKSSDLDRRIRIVEKASKVKIEIFGSKGSIE